MSMSHRARRNRRIIVGVLASSALVSAIYGYLSAPPNSPPLVSALLGVANAFAVATPIVVFELHRARWAFARSLRRLPLLAYLALKIVYYLTCIIGGTIVVRLIFQASLGRPFGFDRILANSFVFGSAMVIVGVFTFEMGRLLGFGTLRNLLTGRYVQPKREQMVFLLIDMKDSTGVAERLGPVRFHELLNDFFHDIADAALEADAEIHKYVGDEAILTWPSGEALAEGDCLICPFLASDYIAANADRYRTRFGVIPQFRAALHYGEIVAGEIGDLRREIAYIGDTLNVAARLLDAAKETGHDILVSADLLNAVPLPSNFRAEPLPTLSIRGRRASLEIFALARVGQD